MLDAGAFNLCKFPTIIPQLPGAYTVVIYRIQTAPPQREQQFYSVSTVLISIYHIVKLPATSCLQSRAQTFALSIQIATEPREARSGYENN